MIRILCSLGLLLSVAGSHAADHQLFGLDFGDRRLNAARHFGPGAPLYQEKVTLTEGPAGRPAVSLPVGGQLVYEGSGNFFIPSGTVSFWWRADAKPLKVESDLLSLSSLQRFYFCRWVRIVSKDGRISATLYHGNSAQVFEDAGSIPGSVLSPKVTRHELTSRTAIREGEWVHVALTWDMGRGCALYLDGQLQASVLRPWFFAGDANHISLAAGSPSYAAPREATFPQSFAGLTIYDCWLSAEEIAAVSKGEAVKPRADFAPMLAERSTRMGLKSDQPFPAADLKGDEALWITQVDVPTAYDVLRRSYAAFDGDMGRPWPMYQGYRDSGKTLRFETDPALPVTTVQTLAVGEMTVEAVEKGGQRRELLKVNEALPAFLSISSDDAVNTSQWEVQRRSGLLFHLSLLNVSQRSLPEGDGWQFSTLSPTPDASQPQIGLAFPPYDRTLLAPGEGSGTVLLPAGRAVHLMAPTVQERSGLSAIALDLAMKNVPDDLKATVMVIDPLNGNRRALLAGIAIRNGSEGRARVVLDLRDLIYAPGSTPWVVLTLSDAVELDIVKSRLGMLPASVEKAGEEFAADQFAILQDEFQERSEGRPWSRSPEKLKLLGTLLRRIDAVRELRPGDPTIEGYWHWTHPKEAPPELALPVAPDGVPSWAFYTHRAVNLFRDAAHWWIDHRQTESGEFGAPDGINDDTDLIQDWLAIDLMQGPDEKIRRSVDKVADISWRLSTTDGVSNQVTDTLHIYEWGINAQTLGFVMRYGDPVYYSRLLRFASHYLELMAEACGGRHLHFKTWYFGANRMITEGVYANDILLNSLLLQPAMLLAWYNGDPEAASRVERWSDSMREHIMERARSTPRIPAVTIRMPSGEVQPKDHFSAGFPEALWSAYASSGDRKYLEAIGSLIDFELNRKPMQDIHATGWIAGSYLAATGDSRWDQRWKEKAEDPGLWMRSLHNNNYNDLNGIYAHWLRSGSDDVLDHGSKLALYHLTWSMPMLTEAEATTDRVWLPQNLANQMTLGSISILRNRLFPRHVVSWENASGAFTPLVRKHGADHLKVELWNLEKQPVRVNARLWGLAAGEYEITLTPQLSGAEESADAVIRQQELERYSLLPLELPSGGRLDVEIRQIKAGDDPRGRTDLAISPLDARYDVDKKVLICNVYNIGRLPTGEFQFIATAPDGASLFEQQLASLAPPENYHTKRHAVEIPVADPNTPITLTLKGENREITLHNNQLTLTPGQLP